MNEFLQKAYPQCLKYSFYKRGITVLEILIVIAIIGVLIFITLPQFSKIKEEQILKNTVSDIISILHKAESQSLASVDSKEYGVHFQSDKIILFKDKVFSPESVDNKITDISSGASISNVTLGGVSAETGDVYFERLTGVPSKTGTITVLTHSYSKIITISATGAVSVN